MAEELEQITVVAKRGQDTKAYNRVVLWEVHDQHPTGEAYVVRDGIPVDVALTPKVKSLLGSGDIEKTNTSAAKPVEQKADDTDGADNAPILPAGINRGARPSRPG